MPKGLKRYYGRGDLHFLTFSCYRRRPILGAKRARDRFVKMLEELRRKHKFLLLGWCAVPEITDQAPTPSGAKARLIRDYLRGG